MLRQKAHIKVTRGGSVNKVIREHYLRDDIPCGVEGCMECAPHLQTLLAQPILLNPLQQTLCNNAVGKVNIILPDTNIILHHLDVLETTPFTDVVILQTVLEEVKSNSPAIYKRIRSLIAEGNRRFFVFSNENHRQTFLEKVDGESPNDRNDRSIRKASEWYQSHLQAQSNTDLHPVAIVLLTNDVANAKLAKEAGLNVFKLRDYVKGFEGIYEGTSTLLDMLETVREVDGGHQNEIDYPEYQSTAILQTGVQNGRLFQGTFQVSPYDRNRATVTSSGKCIEIAGKLNMNRALQGDIVVVELISDEPAAVPQVSQLEKGEEQQSEELVQFPSLEVVLEEPVLEVETAKPLSGRIVGVIRRSNRTYCGSIDRKTIKAEGGPQNVLVVPLDRRMPRIRIRTRNAVEMANQRLVISVDGWERTSKYPNGHLVRILGIAGERATETQVILLEHDVAYADFTPQVLSCLPSEGAEWKPTESDYAERMDLRSLWVCSVDPPGCTDIDDALHATILPNGNIEVGVHIADVTHFVKADTPLDMEASSRSTTVYLVDRRIDMLPSLLGTNLCSLKCNVERLAFSCIWELTPQAEIVQTRFGKSIICSKASFTYDQAQSRLEDPNAKDELSVSLKLLNELAKQLKARRIAAGALTLASPEVRFTLDMETQNPVDVILKEMKEANSLVEEFMLLANISVAQEIFKVFPDTAVLRRHPSPPAENFTALNRALMERGFDSLSVESSGALAASLDRTIDPSDSFFNRLVRIMTTRCMYQAQYFAAGSHSYDAFWHYGLACPIYTHFTSPIRRYADVLVHRLLAAAVAPDKYGLSGIALADRPKLEDICNNMNYRHRMAQQAQRASIELFTHLFFRGKTVVEAAYIVKVMATGIVALIPQYGIEGIVRWEEAQLASAGYSFDSEHGRIVDSQSIPVIKLFEQVSISLKVIEEESSQRQKLIVHLVKPFIEGITIEVTNDVEKAPSPVGSKRPIDTN